MTHIRDNRYLVGFMALSLIVAFTVFYQVRAEEPVTYNYYIEHAIFNVGGVTGGTTQSLGAFISSGTNLTDVAIANDLTVAAQTTLTGTTTQNLVTLGSLLSKALTFTAGVTTTPGAVVSLQNTGATKLCIKAFVDITNAPEGSIQFRLASSTSAADFAHSLNLSNGIIASSTIATGTTGIVSQSMTPTSPWEWIGGQFLNGAIIAGADSLGQGNASSSNYTDTAAKLYVSCITQ